VGIISFDNYLNDPAAVLTSPQTFSTTLPLANLKTRSLAQVARSTVTGGASTQFDIDLGREKPINLVAMLGVSLHQASNGGSSQTMRVRFYTSSFADTPTYDSGSETYQNFYRVADDYPLYVAKLIPFGSAGTNARLVRINFQNNDLASFPVPAGFVKDFGRIWIGSAPPIDFSGNWKVGAVDSGVSDRSPGGQSLTQYGSRLRQLECGISYVSVENALGGERATDGPGVGTASWTLQQIQARCGTTREAFVAVRHGTHHEINNTGVYGTFQNNSFIAQHLWANQFSQPEPFTVLEER